MKPHVLRVTAALIEREGCYLAALRPSGDRYGGLWEFPGGKIERGETPEDCLRREILEELGLKIEVIELWGTNRHEEKDRVIELLLFRTRWISGSPRPLQHAALRWIGASELLDMAWSPADLPLVERLHHLEKAGSD